jgi:hypothetical protein
MRAAVYCRFGGPDTVRVIEVPQPSVGSDEVLVQSAFPGEQEGVPGKRLRTVREPNERAGRGVFCIHSSHRCGPRWSFISTLEFQRRHIAHGVGGPQQNPTEASGSVRGVS